MTRLVAVQGGSTNSRPADKCVNTFGSTVGLDTVRLRWRSNSENYGRFRAAVPYETGPRGELWTRIDKRFRAGVFPDGHVYVEARAAVLVDHDRDSHRLCAADELQGAALMAAAELEDVAGLYLNDDARVARVDPAGELAFADGREGLRLLRGLASLDVPHVKLGVEGIKGGNVQTVTLRSVRGKTVLGRLYDKGVESGTHAPGERVRYEAQVRSRKAREDWASAFDSAEAARLHVRHLRWFAPHNEFAIVCRRAVVRKLNGQVARGEIAPHKAERLIGWAVLYDEHGASLRGDRGSAQERWYYRRVAELRALGVAIDRDLDEGGVVIPLGQYVRELARAWAA